MVSIGDTGVSNLISDVPGNLGRKLDKCSGGEVTRAGFAREPVRRQGKPTVDRLLDRKLAAAALRRRKDIRAGIVAAECESRLRLECLYEFRVRPRANVIGFVLQGNEQIVSNHECPAVVAAIVRLPFDIWCDCCLARTR